MLCVLNKVAFDGFLFSLLPFWKENLGIVSCHENPVTLLQSTTSDHVFSEKFCPKKKRERNQVYYILSSMTPI